jgi:hypothetical protein
MYGKNFENITFYYERNETMNLFFQELKKTLRPIPLLVLVVVTALYSYTFLTVPYSTLNTMHWTSDYIRLTAELKELVGEPVTGEKIAAGVDTLRQKSEAFIEEHISNIPELAELGVSDFEIGRASCRERVC